MGTSKGYSMPTGGDWTPLKTEASKFVKNDGANKGSGGSPTAHLVNRYLSVIKKSGYGSSGGGVTGSKGGGGKGGFGRAVAKSAQRLGGFLSRVADVGLTEALREIGLSDLIGKSAEDVINGITDAFTDPASSLDDEAARIALYELNKEILEECNSYNEIEDSFKEIIDEPGIVKTIVDFFSRYIYRIFCRDFYEGWQKKAGADQAAEKLEDVKGYIFSSARDRFAGETTNRNWAGNDGLKASREILKDTVDIFEVE